MIDNNKIELLKKFPLEPNTNILNETIIHIASKNLLFLKSDWELDTIKGESFVFLTNDILNYDESDLIHIITPYVLDDIHDTCIDKYSFKKIKEYSFLYYTIK